MNNYDFLRQRQLAPHKQAALRAAAIQARIDDLSAVGPNASGEILAELEDLLGEVTFKWDRQKAVAHFNGLVTTRTATSCRKMLASMPTDFRLYLNSIGGDAVAGIAIFNLLREASQRVEVVSTGMAHSAASLIFCGGDTRLVAKAATVGVHRSWTMEVGNAEEMRKQAEDLDRLDAQMLEVYGAVAKPAKMDAVLEAMIRDTQLPGDEAVDLGLATGIAQAPAKKGMPKKDAGEGKERDVKAAGDAELDAAREEAGEKLLQRMAEEMRAANDGTGDAPDTAALAAAEPPPQARASFGLHELVDPNL